MQGFSPRTRSDGQLIRFGESGARADALGRPRPRRARGDRRLSSGGGKTRELDGARLASTEQLAARVPGARLHPRPPGRRQGRPGSATRLLRPCARPSGPAARRSLAGVRRDARPAQRRPAAGAARPLADASAVAVDERVAASPPTSSRRARRRSAALAPGFEERRGRPRPPGRRGSTTTASRRPSPISRPGSTRDIARGATGLGPHLDDIRDPLPATATCVASAPRASSGWRCSRSCWRRRSCCRRAAAPAARRRALRARPAPPRRARRTRSPARPGRDHGDAPLGATRSSRRRSWR